MRSLFLQLMQKNLFTLQQISEDLGYSEIYSKSIFEDNYQDISIKFFIQNMIFSFAGFNRTSVNAVRKTRLIFSYIFL